MSSELIHYGVKGMKWGVRRSKNQLTRTSSNKTKSDDYKIKASRKADSKNRRSLSDAELKRKIERLKLEKQFKDLTDEDISPGKKIASDILKSAGTKVLTTAAAGAAAYAIKVAMTKNFDIKEAANYIASNPNKKK